MTKGQRILWYVAAGLGAATVAALAAPALPLIGAFTLAHALGIGAAFVGGMAKTTPGYVPKETPCASCGSTEKGKIPQ